ncbi:hypothetical protein GCM10009804_00060 [Kribbella hippodromi]|uniref:Uncharacterized protein n=1 Tax=Kribbella hippodromi TaxID=434347 RepID=A0ABN2BV96_9ACTN
MPELGVHQMLEFTPVEEDAAAVTALVDGDAAAFVRSHRPTALGTDQAFHSTTVSDETAVTAASQPTLSNFLLERCPT